MQLKKIPLILLFSSGFLESCNDLVPVTDQSSISSTDSINNDTSQQKVTDNIKNRQASLDSIPHEIINTRDVSPETLLSFARTLVGTPYKYASADAAEGFDCSGFITYVFNNFKIQVPRSSIDFTNAGVEVAVEKAIPGDLILFTGTDSTQRFVGHMGIINEQSADSTTFIHSTSGKAYGVTVTPLNKYYKSRFVKVIRIFPSVQ